MFVFIIFLCVLALMMLRSGVTEYKYYQSVKTHEPEVWEKLGSPGLVKLPWVFLNFENSPLFKRVTSQVVLDLAAKNRRAGIHFLASLVIFLVASIVFFKMA